MLTKKPFRKFTNPSSKLNYSEFENIILNLPRSSVLKKHQTTYARLNFEIVQEALEYLEVDFAKLKVIHVTGTNGKGSVCCKIAHALAKSGYCVGLFTSPHIISLRERIALLQPLSSQAPTYISEPEFVECGKRVLNFFHQTGQPSSFFDFLTIVAILWFYKHRAIVVCEVGIGGRFDSTNFLQPVLSIITSISFDHQELLGESLEEIAWHKAGIIKPHIPVVLGAQVKELIIWDYAKKMQAPVLQSSEFLNDYELDNRLTALEALRYLSAKFSIHNDAISFGLQQIPQGRYQKLLDHNNHLWILDVGHNYEGISQFLERACREFSHRQFIIVFAIAKDKQYSAILLLLSKFARKIFLVKQQHTRLEDPDVLQQRLAEFDFKQTSMALLPNHMECISQEGQATNLPVLVCGSFLLAQTILKNWRSAP